MGCSSLNDMYEQLEEELNALTACEGFSPSDLLSLPPAVCEILQKMARTNGMKLSEIAEEVNRSPAVTEQWLHQLIGKGYLSPVAIDREDLYKVRFKRRTSRIVTRHGDDIWGALDGLGSSGENKKQ